MHPYLKTVSLSYERRDILIFFHILHPFAPQTVSLSYEKCDMPLFSFYNNLLD